MRQLSSLSISGCRPGIHVLIDGLRLSLVLSPSVVRLRRLSLTDIGLRAQDVQSLASLITQQFLPLHHLDLSWNPLGDDAVPYLEHVLHSLVPSLRSLRLSHLQLQTAGWTQLSVAISKITLLQHLDLSMNFMGSFIATTVFFTAFQNKPGLQRLKLSGNVLGPSAAHSISICLQRLPALQYLDLSLNHLQTQGFKALCQRLRYSSLQVLDVSRNRIGTGEGWSDVADALKMAVTLRTVMMDGNVLQVGEVLSLMKSVTQVKFWSFRGLIASEEDRSRLHAQTEQGNVTVEL
jgi:Ran GTPase-activating protein (RanGAP) involved in mRNA processing and transport